MNGIKLLSTGSALPRQVVTNDDMAKRVDTSDEWIASRTGIRSRYHCTGGEDHTSLCLAAAKQALERSGIGAEQIGACIRGRPVPGLSHPRRRLYLPARSGLPGGHGVL